MLLQNSDYSGMSLITSQLTGNNYLTWSRLVKITLRVKTKLGFIDGRCKRPYEKDAKFKLCSRWIAWCDIGYSIP